MTSSTKLDNETLPGTLVPFNLRRRPLEAITLLSEIHVQWLDAEHQNRLGYSRWYWPLYQCETASSLCEDASLADPDALA